MYSAETLEFAQHKENEAEKLAYRFHAEKSMGGRDRDNYMRDYARVLYCSSFRRLQGKMQLLSVNNTKFSRNRLTHSLEVAQIARSIAMDLGLKHPAVTETCALIHDIGNPPFGHHGERVLHLLAKDVGGYEGNAQAFRIVHNLETKSIHYSGLNLTLRTIWGTIKYFHTSAENPNKFLYDDNYIFLKEQLDKNNITDTKSIDAQIMDIADEIAYAAHDLEDAINADMVDMGELLYAFKISEKYSDAYDTFKEIIESCQKEAGDAYLMRTSEEFSYIFIKELTSTIINTLCKDIAVVNNNGVEEIGYLHHAKLAAGLKNVLSKMILKKKSILQYEKRGENIIRGLFQVYSDEQYNPDLQLFPAELRYRVGKENRTRLITDYISGTMDAFATQEYIKYFGESEYNKLYKNHIAP